MKGINPIPELSSKDFSTCDFLLFKEGVVEATKVEIVKLVAEVENVWIFVEGETNKAEILWNLQRDVGFRRSGSGWGICGESERSREAAQSGEELGVKNESSLKSGMKNCLYIRKEENDVIVCSLFRSLPILGDSFRCVSEIFDRFPRIVFCRIAGPFDEVFSLLAASFASASCARNTNIVVI